MPEWPQPLVQRDRWVGVPFGIIFGGQEGGRDGLVLPLDVAARAAVMLGRRWGLGRLPDMALLGEPSR